MAICAGCRADFDIDEFDVALGDELSCPECGANLEVVGVAPIELELAAEAEDDTGAVEFGDENGAFGHGPDGGGGEFD